MLFFYCLVDVKRVMKKNEVVGVFHQVYHSFFIKIIIYNISSHFPSSIPNTIYDGKNIAAKLLQV